MTQSTKHTKYSVALDIESLSLEEPLKQSLQMRGCSSKKTNLKESTLTNGMIIAFSRDTPPTPQEAKLLAINCEQAAKNNTPVIMLTAFKDLTNDHIAALAYLTSHGAILCNDPDVWTETIVLLACYQLPQRLSVSVVTSTNSWLYKSINALPDHYKLSVFTSSKEIKKQTSGNIILFTPDESIPQSDHYMAIPIVGSHTEIKKQTPVLFGIHAAMEAIHLAQQHRQTMIPLSLNNDKTSPVDQEKWNRQIQNLDILAGDHETKALLSAYHVPITRQAVATTPSAATRITKKTGWPVDMKPWNAHISHEQQGGPIERNLSTAADVRRVFVTLAQEANLPKESPMIIRCSPFPGRNASVYVKKIMPLGWFFFIDIAGISQTFSIPLPASAADIWPIAQRIEASRQGDQEPDREAFCTLLYHVSLMFNDHGNLFESLLLPSIVIGEQGQGALIVDARANLLPLRTRKMH